MTSPYIQETDTNTHTHTPTEIAHITHVESQHAYVMLLLQEKYKFSDCMLSLLEAV